MNKNNIINVSQDFSMSNSIQLDSLSWRNFIQYNFLENDFLSGVEDGTKRQQFFLSSSRRSCLVRLFLLNANDWLKCKEVFDWSAEDVGDS